MIEQAGKGCDITKNALTAIFSSTCTARVGEALKTGRHDMSVRIDEVGGGFVALGVCKGDYKLDRPPNKRGAYTLLSNDNSAKNGSIAPGNHSPWTNGDTIRLCFDVDAKTLSMWHNGKEGKEISGIKDSGLFFCLGGGDGSKLTLIKTPDAEPKE